MLRSTGADAFTGFAAADYLFPQSDWEVEHHNKPGEPRKYHASPLLVSALRAGDPAAMQLFRRCFGLMSPAIPMTAFFTLHAATVVSAAVPLIDTSELLLLNDPSRKHRWINGEGQAAIAAELLARGCKAHISELHSSTDIGPFLENLGAAETAGLLSARCTSFVSIASGERCGQSKLAYHAKDLIERTATGHLTVLLREPSTTAPVRVAAALQLVRRGGILPSEYVTKESVTEALAHRCAQRDYDQRHGIELLDRLLNDPRFGWAEEVTRRYYQSPGRAGPGKKWTSEYGAGGVHSGTSRRQRI